MGIALCKPCFGDCCNLCDDTGEFLHNLRVSRRVNSNDNSDDYIQLDDSLPNENNESSPIPLINRALLQANHENKVKQMFESIQRPPSVEDEKQYMRLSLSNILEKQKNEPKECSICMEGFNEEDTEVQTLCQCGENKHSYHLHCLLWWKEKSGKQNCPVCDSEIFFDQGDLRMIDSGTVRNSSRLSESLP